MLQTVKRPFEDDVATIDVRRQSGTDIEVMWTSFFNIASASSGENSGPIHDAALIAEGRDAAGVTGAAALIFFLGGVYEISVTMAQFAAG